MENEFKTIFIIPNQEADSYGYGKLFYELKEGWGVVDSHYVAEESGIYFVLGREVKAD